MRRIFILLKKWIVVCFISVVLVGCSKGTAEEVPEVNQEEMARKHLEEYLEFMKTGDLENAAKYLATNDTLIDVFEFTYLDTTEEYLVPEKTTILRSQFLEDSDLQKEYVSWVDMVEHFQENDEYETFTSNDKYDTVSLLIYWEAGSGVQAYKFLYDMEIANGLGNKLFKKVEFDLQYTEEFNGTEEGYKITKLNIR